MLDTLVVVGLGVGHKPPGHKPPPGQKPPFPPSACTEQTYVVTKLFIYLYTW